MAASSNSEFQAPYDVFLSFRGYDTRTKFTDHLYDALKREGFETFRDNEGIGRGENIKSELQRAIWNSSMSVIVISENYATSKSCLLEIKTILEHREKKPDYFILPVFYEVDPWEIKEQAKNLDFKGKKVTDEEVKGWSAVLKEVASMAGMVSGNQCDRHEAEFVKRIIGVLKWKQAEKHLGELDKNMENLKRNVEYLSGQENDINYVIRSAERWPWKRPKKEVEFWLADVQRFKDDVQRLEQKVAGERNVRNVISRVRLGKRIMEKVQEAAELQEKRKSFNDLLVDACLTGRQLMPPTKDFVESTEARNVERVWECLMSDEVRQIGVYGVGGVGKTTIMKHIHNRLLEETDKFDSVFWVTVSNEFHSVLGVTLSKKAFNFIKLQRDIAKELNFRLSDDEDERRRASQLHATLSRWNKYILIIDDLRDAFSLESVGIPEPTESNGCKIVLTSGSLDICRRMDCEAVKVERLTHKEASTLFRRKAFGDEAVVAPYMEEIAAEIVHKCAGLPLAIVTIAASVRGLEGVREWRDALSELISSREDAGDDETEDFQILESCYDRLCEEIEDSSEDSDDEVFETTINYCSSLIDLIDLNKLLEDSDHDNSENANNNYSEVFETTINYCASLFDLIDLNKLLEDSDDE